MTPRPELACVVLCVGNRPELVAAVESLLDQGDDLEIIVVNSGGGGAAKTLGRYPKVQTIEFEPRLLPGAARNAGIARSTARFISFLAADCIAERGWSEARLAAHRAGHAAVASAVTNPFRRNVAAWTSYVSLFNRRMPGVAPPDALLYGVSYDRALFERYGLFREDMRGGEDTEFHQRFHGEVDIYWNPQVRTAHRHSSTMRALLHDHFRRGRRTAAAWQRMNGPATWTVVRNVLKRAPSSARIAWTAASPGERKWIVAASLLIVLPTIAYAFGSLIHAVAPVDEGDE